MMNANRSVFIRCLALMLAASLCFGLLAVAAMAEGAQKVNLMVRPEDMSEVSPENAENTPFWGQYTVLRGWVNAVEFHDTQEGHPENIWDFSARWGEKSVIGWYENNTLHLAANGKITLNPNSGWMFAYFKNLRRVNFNDAVDTTGVTSMEALFFCCCSLKELDVSGFDTSAVTDMSRMFGHCESLKSLDLSNFDTSKVNRFSFMFFNDKGLKELNVSSFDTSAAQYMHSMFYGCSGLTDLDLSGFNTAKAITMGFMFEGCNGLANLDFSTLSTAKARTTFKVPGKK